VPCREISAEWGAQRIKGLSVTKAVAHAVTSPFRRAGDTTQKGTETSLIERFLYPKYGPGQIWEEVARRVAAGGGVVRLNHRIVGLEHAGGRVEAAVARDTRTGTVERICCDHFLSTMPVRDLVAFWDPTTRGSHRSRIGCPIEIS